jgi:hypothetical protein
MTMFVACNVNRQKVMERYERLKPHLNPENAHHSDLSIGIQLQIEWRANAPSMFERAPA